LLLKYILATRYFHEVAKVAKLRNKGRANNTGFTVMYQNIGRAL